ncbi:MAG: PAS domain-containing protein [Proteobacteria bacterium]|nr:PAS domain-containing protein [Pseudomonadota bacterium]
MIDPDVTALAEQVASPLLQRLLQEWDARRRGRRMPARADFQPEALRFILGSLILFDVLAEPLRFRYRLVGTNLSWRRGVDLTGSLLDEHPDQRLREEAVPVCRIVVDTRRPYLFRPCFIGTSGTSFNYEALLLPLSSDDAVVEMIMAGQIFPEARTGD